MTIHFFSKPFSRLFSNFPNFPSLQTPQNIFVHSDFLKENSPSVTSTQNELNFRGVIFRDENKMKVVIEHLLSSNLQDTLWS